MVGLHCPPQTGVFFAKLFQKAFGTCHSDNGDVAAAAAATAALLLVDACAVDVVNPDVDAPTADDIAKSGGDTPAAAAAANAFNNFKSFLRADDDADPLGSTHIT